MNPTPVQRLHGALQSLPLVAILRGLTPAEAPAIGAALVDSGFRLIEVPLNSPQPLDSIALLARQCPQALVGAGTVLTPQQVRDVHAAGGELIVSPHFDAAVVREAVALGLACLPGVATPTEAFAALAAGAAMLKLFPGEMLGPPVLKAWRSVLPAGTPLFAVGGVGLHNLAQYKAAGAAGAGLGPSLYKTGMTAGELESRARELHDAWAAG
jgi:2-dehydro-3-deoxyphosphogalactonate aldolase